MYISKEKYQYKKKRETILHEQEKSLDLTPLGLDNKQENTQNTHISSL